MENSRPVDVHSPTLCSLCFSNYGLREEATKIGVSDELACQACGKQDGAKLTVDQLKTLAWAFFVEGSAPLETGGWAPIYMINTGITQPASFDETLQNDSMLLQEITGLRPFYYSPALWRFGYTTQYWEIKEADPARADAALDQIVACAPKITLDRNSTLFRIRTNLPANEPERILPTEFDTPPQHCRTRFGRFDDETSPLMYCSYDLEVCLHECRVTIGDTIHVATIQLLQDLPIVNLAGDFPWVGPTEFENLNRLMTRLSYCGVDEYSVCRRLERDFLRLTRTGDSGAANDLIQDAGWKTEASVDGCSLFVGFA